MTFVKKKREKKEGFASFVPLSVICIPFLASATILCCAIECHQHTFYILDPISRASFVAIFLWNEWEYWPRRMLSTPKLKISRATKRSELECNVTDSWEKLWHSEVERLVLLLHITYSSADQETTVLGALNFSRFQNVNMNISL